MALADKAGLQQQDLLDVLGLGAMANPMVSLSGERLTDDRRVYRLVRQILATNRLSMPCDICYQQCYEHAEDG
jgi:3-hydroxyisobutyrate dehydrogenase-like beta-hydroxyacid dehydrogenase